MKKTRPAAPPFATGPQGAGPFFPAAPFAPPPPGAPVRLPDHYPAVVDPSRVVQLVPSARNPNAVIGLTAADAGLVKQLSVRTGPSSIWRLIEGARAAGFAVLIRSDLPPID